jgi:hypothetical protein
MRCRSGCRDSTTYRRDHGIKNTEGRIEHTHTHIYIYIYKLRNLGRVNTGEIEGEGREEE